MTSGIEAGDSLIGPIVFTIDAEASDAWQRFDLSSASLVTGGDPLGWDIAVRRFHIIVNGGGTLAGRGGIANLGVVAFDSVIEAPATGYVETRTVRDTVNDAIDHWYTYSWISHILEPDGRVFAVRTADGRYAKLRVLSYYCPGARPGCLTLEYVYQGNGSRSFSSPRDASSATSTS